MVIIERTLSCYWGDIGRIKSFFWPPGPLVRYHTLNSDATCHKTSYAELRCVSYTKLWGIKARRQYCECQGTEVKCETWFKSSWILPNVMWAFSPTNRERMGNHTTVLPLDLCCSGWSWCYCMRLVDFQCVLGCMPVYNTCDLLRYENVKHFLLRDGP
jgi:hypothetical protein